MTAYPKDFVWGAASSAYQIEGDPLADGGGPSVWDTFSHTPGKTFEGNTGDTACRSYRHPERDVEHLKQLGLTAYRFSTSWARIDPKGTGDWNPLGLAYYDRLVELCLREGITPYMTLYHWELPQALEDRGGWLNPETPRAFARFASMMAGHFRGRVSHYFLLNEPQCVAALGYGSGIHAPGRREPQDRLFLVWKHLLLAYGLGAKAMRQEDSGAKLGIATTGRLCYPEREADTAAAREATFRVSDEDWMFTHQMALDPICLGRFPDCPPGPLQKLMAAVTKEELAAIHQIPDFLGFNIYNGWCVRAGAHGPQYIPRYEGFPRTALKWPVTPEVMDYGPFFLWQRYGIPCYITENGLSCNDIISLDGAVHDPNRQDFLHRSLRCLRNTFSRGTELLGYFHWSLTDNFEWHSGYSERFGLVYVDFPTGNRIYKDSAGWFAQTVKSNGAGL